MTPAATASEMTRATRRRRLALAALLLSSSVVGARPAVARAPAQDAHGDTQVLLTKNEALRVVFPGCERALELRRILTRDEKVALERNLARSIEERGFLVYLGVRGAAH